VCQWIARVHTAPPPGNPVGRSACWIAVSQTLFAVTNIAAGLVTSNENVANDDKMHCGIFNPGTRELFHDPRSLFFIRQPHAANSEAERLTVRPI
jgi:hypothetical protein